MYRPHRKLYESRKYSNRFLWEVLPDNSWKGKPCFVVGGGPSLQDFKWRRLRGHRTIGVNRAFEKFDPTVIFSMDTRFLKWVETVRYGHESFERFNESKAYKVWLVTYTCDLPPQIFIIPVRGGYTAGHYAFTNSMLKGLGHGNNSGYGALNLAYCLGANPIYLLGFDLKHNLLDKEEGKKLANEMLVIERRRRYQGKVEEDLTEPEKTRTHWHTGHPMPQEAETIHKFIHYFDRLAPKLKKEGVRVINLNPDSALRCFEFSTPEKVFH